jgi:hypothetical protein
MMKGGGILQLQIRVGFRYKYLDHRTKRRTVWLDTGACCTF